MKSNLLVAQGSGPGPVVLKRRRREDIVRTRMRSRRVERRDRVTELQLRGRQPEFTAAHVQSGPAESERLGRPFQGRRLNRPRHTLPT